MMVEGGRVGQKIRDAEEGICKMHIMTFLNKKYYNFILNFSKYIVSTEEDH